MREIANDRLTLADIPDPGADWEVIENFALTFDGSRRDEWRFVGVEPQVG